MNTSEHNLQVNSSSKVPITISNIAAVSFVHQLTDFERRHGNCAPNCILTFYYKRTLLSSFIFLNASLEIFEIHLLFFLRFFSDLVIPANEADEDPSHTRNSSTTSQASVGYSSQNSGTGNSQPGHSRQSSSGGESSHGR